MSEQQASTAPIEVLLVESDPVEGARLCSMLENSELHCFEVDGTSEMEEALVMLRGRPAVPSVKAAYAAARHQKNSDPAPSSISATVAPAQRESVGTGTGDAHTSAQSVSARVAHCVSQLVSQQNPSWAQTAEQQDSASQEGEPLALQQSPIPAQVAPLHTDPPQS